MANGAFKFKDNSGNVVSFISGSGSNIAFSGGTLDLSGMTGLTLGNLTLSGTTQNAISTSHAASYLLTSSFNTYSGTTDTVIGTLQTSTSSLNSFTSSTNTRLNSIEGVSGSYATTGSNQFKNDQVITGSLTVTGFIEAQELRTTYISSSILYRSGSTKFGDELGDTHSFTGSLTVNGSLTATGNVGIGTSNPGQKLEVVGGEIKAGRVDSSNEGGQISFGRASDNATGWYIDNYGNSSSTQLRFVNVADSAVVMTLSGSTASIGTSYMAYPLNIEAMSGGGQLALTRSGAVAEFYMGGTTGGGTQLYVRSGGSGGVRLDAGSTGWVSASDIRLKDIEKPIENAVENLSTLQTVYYSWKNSDNKSLHLGLIAQEVESVFPEIVSESSIDEMKGVTYTELIPVLVKAIQEQQTQIEFLKTEIETLKQ